MSLKHIRPTPRLPTFLNRNVPLVYDPEKPPATVLDLQSRIQPFVKHRRWNPKHVQIMSMGFKTFLAASFASLVIIYTSGAMFLYEKEQLLDHLIKEHKELKRLVQEKEK